MIVVVTILALLAAFVGRSLIPLPVEATSTLRFTPPANTDSSYTDRIMNTFIQIAESKPVMDEFRDQAGLDHEELVDINIQLVPNSELIEIVVSDNDPERAKGLANIFTQVVIEARPISDVQISVVEYASLPDSPPLMRQIIFYLITALVGVILGAVLAYVLELIDTSLRSTDVMERASGLKVIGEIPVHRGKLTTNFILDTYPFYDSFLRLRTNILSREELPKPLVLAITSAVPEDGKSTITANIGRSFGLAGLKTVIIDTDMIHPTIHSFYELNNNTGLSSILSGEKHLSQVVTRTDYLNVDVITSGPPRYQSADLLRSELMKKVLIDLREIYDLILLDTPAILSVADGLMVVPNADGVVVVSNLTSTTEEELKTCIQQLNDSQAFLIGGIINKAKSPRSQKYSAYYQKEMAKTPQILGKLVPGSEPEIPGISSRVAGMEPVMQTPPILEPETKIVPRFDDPQIGEDEALPELGTAGTEMYEAQHTAAPKKEETDPRAGVDADTLTKIGTRVWGLPKTPEARKVDSDFIIRSIAYFYQLAVLIPADIASYIGSLVSGRVIARKRWQKLAKTFIDDSLV